MYGSIASSMVINACFFHSRGCLSGNFFEKIPKLATSSCSISRTVRTKAFVDHGAFPLPAAINLLRSPLWTPAVHYTVYWPPFTSIWISSHPTACCFLFLRLPVLRTISKWAAWVISLVAALSASRWTNFCLRSCCVRRMSVFELAPGNRPVFDPRSPDGGGCVSMMCWCGIEEEDDNKRK